MRRPARSARVDAPAGAAKRNFVPPKPSGSTSSACDAESSSMSRPVMPMSSMPSPTYTALAVAGLAQHLRGGLGQRPLVGYGDLEQCTVVGHDRQIYRLPPLTPDESREHVAHRCWTRLE